MKCFGRHSAEIKQTVKWARGHRRGLGTLTRSQVPRPERVRRRKVMLSLRHSDSPKASSAWKQGSKSLSRAARWGGGFIPITDTVTELSHLPSTVLKNIWLHLFVCSIVYVCRCTHPLIWREVKGQLVWVSSFLLHLGPRDWTQAVKLGGKWLCALSHRAGPGPNCLNVVCFLQPSPTPFHYQNCEWWRWRMGPQS